MHLLDLFVYTYLCISTTPDQIYVEHETLLALERRWQEQHPSLGYQKGAQTSIRDVGMAVPKTT